MGALGLVAALGLMGPARAAPPPKPKPPAPVKPHADAAKLYVRDLTFDPVTAPPALAPSLRAARENGYAIVQYQPDQALAVYRALGAARVHIYGPVARHGFLVGGASLKQLRALGGVRFADSYHPAFKLAPSLRRAATGSSTAPVTVVVEVFQNVDAVTRAIKAFAKATRVGPGAMHILATLTPAELARVAALPDVRSVDPAMMPLTDLDQLPVRIGVRQQSAPPNFENLDGTGQRYGTYDTGCDTGVTNTLVADLVNRVSGDIAGWINQLQQPNWADLDYAGQPSGHGTSTLDVAIGNGATSTNQLLTGMAYAATGLIRPFRADTQQLSPGYLNIGTALTNAYQWGARVHNNSWTPATGTYPALTAIVNVYAPQGSAVIDNFAYTTWRMFIVTSAGNYANGGQANTMGSNSCSKNSLAIGNSGNGNPPSGAILNSDAGNYPYNGINTNQIAASSGRGPAPGGQLKPDAVAPGQMVAAVCTAAKRTAGTCPTSPYRNEPNFNYSGGTSLSAPAVTGTAVLLREFLANETLLPNPSGMLVKAMLVNSAVQIYNYAPDDNQGWGVINLERAIDGYGGGNNAYYDSLTEPGASFRFVQTGQSVVFPDLTFAPGVPLDITLTWYDPQDTTYAGVLVNDLDLTLTTGNGTVYYGGRPSMHNGVTQPNGNPDTVNNTEKIVLAATPGGGTNFITVTATNIVPGSPQGFAVVLSSLQSQGTAQLARVAGATPLHMVRRHPKVPRPAPRRR